MDSLYLKNAKLVLIKFFKQDNVKKSYLFSIANSYQVLENYLEYLQKDIYSIFQETDMVAKKYTISFPSNGRIIIEKLAHLKKNRITIAAGLVSEIEKVIKRDKSRSSAEDYFNEASRKDIEEWKREHAVG